MKKFMSNLARNTFLASLVVLFAVVSGIIGGCQNPVFDEPTSPVVINKDLSITMKDNTTGALITVDSAYKDQALLFIGYTPLNNVKFWEWNWADPNQTSPDTGKMAVHKYTIAGTYTINLRVYDSAHTLITSVPKTLRIVYNSGYNAKPIFKCLSSVDIGNGNWIVTYGVLRAAIECSPANQPFIVFSEVWGWYPEYLNAADSTIDGYFKHTDTVANNAIRKFSFGGNFAATCYATLYPNPPRWSSEFYIQSESKICVKWINGAPYSITTTTTLPGTVGDIGTAPVMRAGLNVTGDTLYLYFCKLRVTGNLNYPFWVNNISGLSNALNLTTAPGYSDWWVCKIARANIPSNFTLQCSYGDSFGSLTNWASISGSYFYNSQYNLLDFNVNQMGGMKLVDPTGHVYRLQ